MNCERILKRAWDIGVLSWDIAWGLCRFWIDTLTEIDELIHS